MLDGQRVRLESIDANREDSVLMDDHAAMLLPARDLNALRVCEVNQLAVLVGVQDHYINFLFKPNTLFSGLLFGCPLEISLDFKRMFWVRPFMTQAYTCIY